MITIKCHGDYYARDGQLKLLKPFEEIVKAPSLSFFEQRNVRYTGTDDKGNLKFDEKTFINVRGILKKKLLPLLLQNKYQGQFVRIRGVIIDSIEAPQGEGMDLPINLMSFEQLGAYIAQNNIPLDAKSYLNIDDLRTDIAEYLEDAESFKRNFERKSKKRNEEKAFMEMNNLMPVKASTPPIKKSKGLDALGDV